MPIVLLGNHNAIDHDGSELPGQQVTTIHIPEEDTHRERMRTITHEDGLWARMAAPGTDAAWVASDDERLAQALAAHFDCPLIDLDDGHQRLAHAVRAADLGVKPEDLDPSGELQPAAEDGGDHVAAE